MITNEEPVIMRVRVLKESIEKNPPQKEKYGEKILSEVKRKWKSEGDWYVMEFEDRYR